MNHTREEKRMKKHFKTYTLVAALFLLGISILLHQYLNIGVWFQPKDIHHETLALSSFALAIGILVGSNYSIKSN